MKDVLRDVRDKRGKIARMIHSGEMIPLRRGLYATRRDANRRSDSLMLLSSRGGNRVCHWEA